MDLRARAVHRYSHPPENRWGVFLTGLGEFTNVDSTPAAVEMVRIRYGAPLGKPSLKRVLSEDDTNHRTVRGERFDKTVSVTGPGVYVLKFP